MGAAMKNTNDSRAWTRLDIQQLIVALDYLCSQWSMSEERRAGFLDALTAIALVAGLNLPDIWGEGAAIIEEQKHA